jgi:hypothetical protein
MNKEENLPAGEDRVPDEEPPQEQPVNEVPKADAAKVEEISSTAPVAETGQAAILNLQPETEKEMEVHHHTHPAHGKKNWKSYFWEFLMLFLAVFCGFLAEYQLEHKIEKDREKQYAKLLLSDLRADSLYFVDRTTLLETRLKKHKQFYDLMTGSVAPDDKEIINGFLPLFYIYDLRITPGTYNQMKTSGSLRYIETQQLINSLQQYYEIVIPRANQRLEAEMQFYSNILYPFFINHFRIQDIDDEADSVKVAVPLILNRTGGTNQELLNITENYGSDQRNLHKRYIVTLIDRNKELIRLLKEEYHLE